MPLRTYLSKLHLPKLPFKTSRLTRWRWFVVITLALTTFVYIRHTQAANTCVWTGTTDHSTWTNSGNWSGCGGVTPQSADTATFNATGDAVTIPAGLNIAGITTTTGYTGTLTQGGAITLGASGLTVGAGTVTLNGSAVTLNGPLNMTGGTWNMAGSTVTVNGNWAYTAGTLNPGTSTVNFIGAYGATLALSGSQTLNNVSIGGQWYVTYNIAVGTTITVNGTFGGGIFGGCSINGGVIEAKGDVTFVSYSTTGGAGSAALLIDGTADQTWTGASNYTTGVMSLPTTVNKPSGVVHLAQKLYIGGLTVSAGTIDPGTSSVRFTGGVTVSGTFTLNNMDFYSAYSGNITLTGSSVVTVLGTTTVYMIDDAVVGGGTFNINGDISFSGSISNGATGAATFQFSGSNTQNFSSSTSLANYTFTVNKTSGSVKLTSAVTIPTTLTVTNGTFDMAGQSLTLGGATALTVGSSGRFINQGTGTLTLSGTVSNSGLISLKGNATCGGADTTLIRSNTTVQRTWSGTGTTTLWDIDASYQAGSITAYNSTNSGNNAWTFVTPCPPAFRQSASTNTLDTNGLVGLWSFDGPDMTATQALDQSGQGNNGTLSGTTRVQGKLGQALNFNGSGDSVSLGTSSTLNPSYITLSAWVKPSVTGVYQQILSRDNLGGNIAQRSYEIRINNSNTASLTIFKNGGTSNFTRGVDYQEASGSTTLATGTWYHIVGTYDGSTLRLYVNGVQEGSASLSGTIMQQTLVGTYVGASAGGQLFNGTIDDARIYNRALSANEVADLYRLGSATAASSMNSLDTNGLVGQWSFDGQDMGGPYVTATQVIDASGNGNMGTRNGTTTVAGSTAPLDQALSFNGTSDFVNFGNAAAFRGWSSSVTVSLWVYLNSTASSQTIYRKTTNSLEDKNLIYSSATGKLVWNAFIGSRSITVSSATSPVSSTWYLVSITYDGTSAKMYLNGSLDNSTASTSTIWDGTGPMSFGYDNASGNSFFGGRLDDIRIYNRALSAAEVSSLYTNPGTGNTVTSGLIGYWPFDTNVLALDRSGQGNNGTLSGTTRVQGKLGQALNFSGSDVVTASSGDLLGTGPLTICAWIYPRSYGGGSFGRIVTNNDRTLLLAGPGDLEFTSNGGSSIISAGALTLNVWTHACATRDAASNAIVYKNSVASGSGWSGTPNASWPTTIGNKSSLDRNWDGLIDDVRIYNRALSAAEVSNLYKLGH